MRAAVLAGGEGTRLRPYTTVLPKPLIPVGGKPILELIFDWLARSGVEHVEVCIGHLGQLIQTYFSQEGTIPPSLDVCWQWEQEPLGTAGALSSVGHSAEDLLVVNGDVLTDLDPRRFMQFHREQEAALTIAMCQSHITADLGVIEHNGSKVVGYREKPVLSYDTSMGVYAYSERVLRDLTAAPLSFPALVLGLLERDERVCAYATNANWSHVGTLDQYADASLVYGKSDDSLGRRAL